MKKIFLMLTTFLLITTTKVYCAEITDIENHWAKNEIKASIDNDIINGYEDKTFKPNNEVTVAEYLKILIKSANFILLTDTYNLWPDAYIKTAKFHEIISENEFLDYNKKLTRNEIAKITANFINVSEVNAEKTKLKDLDEEYEEDIKKLVNLKVINGYEDKTFRGENNVTRAEAVVIAKRALEARRELISKRKYDVNKEIYLTNSNKDAVTKGDFSRVKYEIRNNKIYFYDSGRYSNLQNHEISGDKINPKKITQMIENMVNEDSYTGILYVPSKEGINQFIIMRGENERYVGLSMFDFSFTYYNNKPYELKRIIMDEIFSEECYMKIEIGKMWRDYSEFLQNRYVDKYKKEKLKESLEIEFGKSIAEELMDYMLEKYELKISRQTAGIEEQEQKIFGKYIVNYYKKTDGYPTFYISVK